MINDLVGDIEAFGKLCGAMDGVLVFTETTSMIRASSDQFDSRACERVNRQAFAEAITQCRVRPNIKLTVDVLSAGVAEVYDWRNDAFGDIAATCNAGPVTLTFSLDKRFVPEGEKRVIVFARQNQAVECLRVALSKPDLLESDVWALMPGAIQPLCLVILDVNGYSSGTAINILGRDSLAKLGEEVSISDFGGYSFDKAYGRFHWSSRFLERLTPLHFRMDKRLESHAGILRWIDACAVNLSMIYLGTRTEDTGSGLATRFSTDRHRFSVRLYQFVSDLDGVDPRKVSSLLDLVDQAYCAERFNDRISLVQASIAAAAFPGEDTTVEIAAVLSKADSIRETAQADWRSFIDEKLAEYRDEASKVEADFVTTCEQYDAATLKIVEEMSKAVIAAIGAVVTAFVVATVKKDANPTAFQVVLAVYILYAAIVVGWMNHRLFWARYDATKAAYDGRKKRYANVLGEVRMKQLMAQPAGEHLTKSNRRFRVWFWVSIGVVAFFIAVIMIVIWYADRILL